MPPPDHNLVVQSFNNDEGKSGHSPVIRPSALIFPFDLVFERGELPVPMPAEPVPSPGNAPFRRSLVHEGPDIAAAHIGIHKYAPFAIIPAYLVQSFRKLESRQLAQSQKLTVGAVASGSMTGGRTQCFTVVALGEAGRRCPRALLAWEGRRGRAAVACSGSRRVPTALAAPTARARRSSRRASKSPGAKGDLPGNCHRATRLLIQTCKKSEE
jgi:hypothetical protein